MDTLGFVTTTYNELRKPDSGDWLRECLSYPLTDNRISDVLISDDCSEDRPALLGLLKDITDVKSVLLPVNRGPFGNKLNAISAVNAEWVICLDSDNSITKEYVDALMAMQPWDPNIIYCPTYAAPKFDYREFAGQLIDIKFFVDNAKKLQCFMNTGNYMVHRETFVHVFSEFKDQNRPDLLLPPYFQHLPVDRNRIEHRRLFDCSDVFFANKTWLKSNRNHRLMAVPNMTYKHRWRPDSVYSTAGKLKEVLPCLYTQELRTADSMLQHRVLQQRLDRSVVIEESHYATSPGGKCELLTFSRSGELISRTPSRRR